MEHLKKWESFNESYDFDNQSGEEFWGDAGAGVLPICKSTGRILLGLRSGLVNEPYTWAGFGGMIDDDEELANPELAARREFEEEAHYMGKVDMIECEQFTSDGGGFKYYNFIGVIEEEFTPVLSDESDDYQWVTLAELHDQDNKHFGLVDVMKKNMDIIKKYAK